MAKKTVLLLQLVIKWTKEEVFDFLTKRKNENLSDFLERFDTCTHIGEYLQGFMSVGEEDSFEWAHEWASLPENRELYPIL